MAISLSASLASNTLHPSPHPLILPMLSNHSLRPSLCPKPTNLATSFSSIRSLVSVSAVSGFPGIASSGLGEEGTTSLLDRVQVFDLEGRGVAISDLWKDRKAVLAFARHFGCVLCRKRADYLAAKKDVMDSAGVALVLIGPGSVDQAKAFSEQTKFQGEVYADPSHSSYKAFEFISGVATTFTPGAGLKIIQAYMEGYRQDWGLSFEKDTRTRGGWQQGGIIIAGPGKITSHTSTRTKKQGMIQILKIYFKHVAYKRDWMKDTFSFQPNDFCICHSFNGVHIQ